MAEEDFYTMWGQWATQTCQKLRTIRKLEKDMEKLTLKKNAYKRDSQRRKECLDAALNFNGFCVEKAFRKECLYTLWLEQKAHERNLELARDRERLAGSWLLESENLDRHLMFRFMVCDYCKKKYIISHLHDGLDLPHREREDYAFCLECLKGACRKCEDKNICQGCEHWCVLCCRCKEE